MSDTGLLTTSLKLEVLLLVSLNGMVQSTTQRDLTLKNFSSINRNTEVSRASKTAKNHTTTIPLYTRNAIFSFQLHLNKLSTKTMPTNFNAKLFLKPPMAQPQ